MSTADGREHTPQRPDWVCRDCLRPWPCPARRQMLLAEYATDPVAVALYLATCYHEAGIQLSDVPADELYQRMLGWVTDGRRGRR